MFLYLIALFICLYIVLNLYYKFRDVREPPLYPKALPIIGHTHLALGNAKTMLKLLEEIGSYCQNNDGVVRLYLVGQTYYFLTDPDDTLTFASTCLAKADYYDFFKPWFGESLILANVEKWKRNRKLLTPAFHQNVLDGFYYAFNTQSKKLIDDLDKMIGKGFFDQTDALKFNALETICLTVLGIDFSDHTLLNKRYIEASHEVFVIMMRRIQLVLLNDWVFSLTSLKRRHDECIKILNDMTDTVLKKRKLEMSSSIASENLKLKSVGKKFKPFMDLLLEMDSMTDKEIRDELNLMIYASHDTSAITLVFALHVIGANPEIQKKLHEEIDAVIGDSEDCFVDKSNVRDLVYVEAVMKEALRLYPVAPIVVRNVDKDVTLKNYTMTKGKYAFLYLSRLNRHPMWGEDAEVFRPERWLEQGGVPDHPAAFASFSVGRRNCIGKAYALMTMKVTLAHIMKHFHIISENSKVELKLDLMLKPDAGHHIAIKRRVQNTLIL